MTPLNGLRSPVTLLCVLLAGCTNTPRPQSAATSKEWLSASVDTTVFGVRPQGAATEQVMISVSCLEMDGTVPSSTGAVKFLAKKEDLRAGNVVLTQAQFRKAAKALDGSAKTDFRSSPTFAVTSGDTAKIKFMAVGETSKRNAAASVTISIGGVPQEFRTRNTGVALDLKPRVLADGKVEIETDLQTTTFDGFEEFKGQSAAVSVPAGFYQPIFTTRSFKKTRLMPKDSVVVWMVEPVENEDRSLKFYLPEGNAAQSPDRPTWLFFLTATTSPKQN